MVSAATLRASAAPRARIASTRAGSARKASARPRICAELGLHPFEQHLLAVDAANAGGGTPGVHGRLLCLVREELVQRVDVALLRRPRIGPLDAGRIGRGPAQLVPDSLLRVGERDGVAQALRHLGLPVEAQDLRGGREQRLRLDERLAETGVEATDDLARQLEVLALVLTDGNARRAVEQDVRGLQHRIGEEPEVDVVGLVLRLVLELRHPLELAVRCHRRQDPAELGVLGHLRLDEQRRLVGIDAAGQELDGHGPRPAGISAGSYG